MKVDAKEILNLLYRTDPDLNYIDDHFAEECYFGGPGFDTVGKDNVIEVFKAISIYLKDLKVEGYKETASPHTLHIDTNLLATFAILPWLPIHMRMILVIHKNQDNKITRFEEHLEIESVLRNLPVINFIYFRMLKPSSSWLMLKMGSYSKVKLNTVKPQTYKPKTTTASLPSVPNSNTKKTNNSNNNNKTNGNHSPPRRDPSLYAQPISD
ncbi:hypothetical protein SAMD00019534_103270, partial [Acytostelium subglobosum LB1]|uniref:hypothetical protein n=1 Tax=Acytostelium subglobosum LB1 TaxID=1410327 RepID=UPI0006447AFF